MKFKPIVTKVEPGAELRWHATTVMCGVLEVDRYFILTESGDGTRLTQGEDCTGVLAGIVFRLGLERQILRGYGRMNRALKARADGEGYARTHTIESDPHPQQGRTREAAA